MFSLRTTALVLLQLLSANLVSGNEDVGAGQACTDAATCPSRSTRPKGATIQAAMREIDHPEQRQELLQMLQVRGAIARSRASREAPSDELAKILPISWVHVPKCGSSFLNTIIHLPGVCPNYTDDLVIDREHFGWTFLDNFTSSHNMDRECPGMMHSNLGHEGIDEWPGWELGGGHFMIMLRQPEQRLISAYKDMRQVFHPYAEASDLRKRDIMFQIGRDDRSWGGWPFDKVPTLREFAEYASGCATRMVTQKGWACSGSRGPPSAVEVAQAKWRLREGFAFVGLTDQWALSICLLSKMYKVGCHASQFLDARPGPDKSSDADGTYPEELLEGYKDPYDGELYAEALKIFEERLQLYNVSEATCEPCYKQAGLSLASARTRVLYQDVQNGREP